MTRPGRVAGLLGAALVIAGCAGSPRAFVADRQVAITAPAAMTVVSAPFEVRWTSTRHGDTAYAVFIDQAPVAPGHTLRDLADDRCRQQAGCPDPAYLAGRSVYVATSDAVEIPTLPTVGGTARHAARPTHTVTIVALDAQGRRRGDAAWTVEFRA